MGIVNISSKPETAIALVSTDDISLAESLIPFCGFHILLYHSSFSLFDDVETE